MPTIILKVLEIIINKDNCTYNRNNIKTKNAEYNKTPIQDPIKSYLIIPTVKKET